MPHFPRLGRFLCILIRALETHYRPFAPYVSVGLETRDGFAKNSLLAENLKGIFPSGASEVFRCSPPSVPLSRTTSTTSAASPLETSSSRTAPLLLTSGAHLAWHKG